MQDLAERMREDAGGNTGSWGQPNAQPEGGDNVDLPAGYTYFGQFVDHDITFDPASELQRQNDPDALIDFRTPRYDLDSLYGSGPADEPFQYDTTQAGRMLLGANSAGELDLPRNAQDTALIGDPRNDENIIVSQLQLAFLKLHNKLANEVEADPSVPAGRRFIETQRRVRWHYQWVIAKDYLPRLCGPALINEQLFTIDQTSGLPQIDLDYYRFKNSPYMPVEFSAAAFRFGHSQVRAAYNLSDAVTNRPIFAAGDEVGEFDDLRGGRRLPNQWTIDWRHFLSIDGSGPQPSRLIDAQITPALFDLPRLPADEPQSLPFRNLKRGQALQLPSGQDVARHLKVPQVFDGAALGGVVDPTPLWFYVLKEAELTASGRQLGPTGARIVAEVLLGLLRGDPLSFFNVEPGWQPTLPIADTGRGFSLGDLLKAATTP